MNSKWQIYRVGLIDFWYYEEEFYFLMAGCCFAEQMVPENL